METLRNAGTHQMVYEDFPPSSDWTQDSNCHVLLIDLPGFKREELKVRVDNLKKVTVSGERQLSENRYSRFKQVYELPEDSDIDNISGRFDGGLLFVIIPKKKPEHVQQQPKGETQHAEEIQEENKLKVPEKKKVDEKHGLEKRHEKQEEHKNEDLVKDEKMKEEPKKDDGRQDGGVVSEKMEEVKKIGAKGRVMGEDQVKKLDEFRKKVTERVKNKEEMEVAIRNTMEKFRKNKSMIITAVLAFSVGFYVSRKF